MLNITSKQALYFALALTILFMAPEAWATLDTQLETVKTLFTNKIGKVGLIVGTVVGIIYSIFTGKVQQAIIIFGILLASNFVLNWVSSDDFFNFFK